MDRQALTALLLIVLVVFQPLGPSIVGVAEAAVGDEKCQGAEGGLYVITFGHVAKECAVENQVENAVEDVKEAQDNQTKVDIYSAAIAQDSATDPFLSTMNNRLQDSKTVAWTHGETELAEAYQNGTSLAVARADAKQAEEDYYSRIQRNILAEWRTEVSAFRSLNERAATEGLLHADKNGTNTSSEVGWPEAENDGQRLFEFANREFKGTDDDYGVDVYYKGIENRTVTLANGTEVTVPAIGWHIADYRGGGTYEINYWYYPGAGLDPDPNDNNFAASTVGIYVSGNFDSSMEPQMLIDFRDYEQLWDTSVQMNKEVKNETDTYANKTYEAFSDGKINATDVISKTTKIHQYGTEGDSMSDVVAALASMGVSTPELNGVGTMNVTYNGDTYTGLVMAESAPNGSWQAGTTYNASNISGPVWIATTGGEAVEVTGEFRIDSITAKDGSSISNVTTTKYVYRTSNTTEYQQLLERMSDLRQELEEREPDTSGGSGGGSGFSIPELSNRQMMLVGGAIVGLGVLSSLGGRR
ncbi:hypothetical protein M0R89_11510 [Halorussus limi]|uniref:Envelope protein N-terminal domain-containing protein n=1 Tax=Halorussus limi TaxID=2938695 RepID=A0A8U0HR93_9EURY|nr:hypothetical protein [Halorussus limi]UPV73174.1 hypothetical protein M0R89_11510 [Halorussus limi]